MKDILKKALLIVFCVLTLIPIGVPVFLSVVALLTRGVFLYDFLMPMELVMFTFAGATGMIVLSILYSENYRRILSYTLLALTNFVLAQIYADFSGLAHGDTELTGFHIFMIAVFVILQHLFALLTVVESFAMLKKLWQVPS
ncbi:MAG: hypothetical protein PWQ80_340 [Thermotoga sp.]|nr:hypothetical protein [Thermotoga sp.]MDK2950232.1 hypothetical protein [Thermotoga sp.]